MTITKRVTIGPDGVARLDVPVGEQHAGEEMDIMVQTPILAPIIADDSAHPDNQPAYLKTLDELHGGIDDPSFGYPIRSSFNWKASQP